MSRKKDRHTLKSSPLLMAVEYDEIDNIRKALDGGEPVDIRDLDGNTPLLRAATLGNERLTKLFLERGADVNAANDIGYTALHFTSQEDHLGVAKLLLAAPGVDVDARDGNGNTPLSGAVFKSSAKMIELLLKAGANPKDKNDHGVSPASLAKSMGIKLPK
jgi:uncharacterized protein